MRYQNLLKYLFIVFWSVLFVQGVDAKQEKYSKSKILKQLSIGSPEFAIDNYYIAKQFNPPLLSVA